MSPVSNAAARNRKRSRAQRWSADFTVRLWRRRSPVLLSISYLAVFAWLMAAGPQPAGEPSQETSHAAAAGNGIHGMDEKNGNASTVVSTKLSDPPRWAPPDSGHPFGLGPEGEDLFLAARRGMASTAVFSLFACLLGAGAALLLGLGLSLAGVPALFSWARRLSRCADLLPGFFLVLVIAAATAGSGLPPRIVLLAAFAAVLALHFAGETASHLQHILAGGEIAAALAAGFPRPGLLLRLGFASALPRCLGLAAASLPTVMLAEMALAFLGFAGPGYNCGALAALGSEHLIEAPWLATHPGFLATATVLVFALLGAWTARLARTIPDTRIF